MRNWYPKGKVLRWVQYSTLPFPSCDLLMPHKPQNQVKICCSKTEKLSRGFSSLTEVRRNQSSCILFLECLRSQVEGKRRGVKITSSPPWYTLRCTTCGAERCWESRCCETEGLSRAVSSFLPERDEHYSSEHFQVRSLSKHQVISKKGPQKVKRLNWSMSCNT